MKCFRAIAALALLCSVFVTRSVAFAQPDAFAKATGKKLIEYGWDRPFPEFVRDHINAMEEQPFEGVIMKLPFEGGSVFTPKNWDKNKGNLQGQLKVLSQIKWNKFTDNFIAMYAASDMDWYSDTDWQKIQANARFVAEAGAQAKCVGLMFDPEPYGNNPWKYSAQKHKDKYSYTQYSEKVYQRGQQFMQAIQSEMPAMKLIMLHGYSMFYSYNHSPDQKTRDASYSQQSYGLFLSFWNGMLDAANPGTRLIDGNESSYYYKSANDFYKAYWTMRQGSRINVPESLKPKFDLQERAANALYPDHLFGLRPKVNIISNYMTPEERQKWLEHNVYYALKTSDQYVWFYGQHMNWWADKGNKPGIMSAKETPGVPPAIKQAVVSARTKLMNGQDLGFDMANVFEEVEANRNKIYFSAIKELKAPAKGAPRKGNKDIYTHGKFVFLQYAKQGDSITINVTAKKVYARETQVELHDPEGKLLKTYTIPYDNKPFPITFTASQTGIYRLVRSQSFSQRIDVDSSYPGNGFYIKAGGDFLPQNDGKLYFEVPAGVEKFTIDISCPSKENYANVALVNAQGKEVDRQAVDFKKPHKFSVTRSDASKSEIWSIDISGANWGVGVKLNEPLLPVVSTNPATLLRKK